MDGEPVPIVRAAHLLPYLNVLRGLGAPWAGELRRAKLPTVLMDKADAYLPLLRSLEFLAACEREIPDLAPRGAQQLGTEQLCAAARSAISAAPTLYAALRALERVVEFEATRLRWWMELDATVKLCSHARIALGVRGRHFVEWHQNLALVNLVRTYAGPEWYPRVIAFESDVAVTRFVRERFPDTHFLTRQSSSWISAPGALLSLPAREPQAASGTAATVAQAAPPRNFADSFRALLKTYLAEGPPTIQGAAEIAHTSVRTLQRRLARIGKSYSDLLDEIRLEAAAQLLTESASNVIDIAYELGYSEASSFSRAFRRLAGLSPRQYRRVLSRPVPVANDLPPAARLSSPSDSAAGRRNAGSKLRPTAARASAMRLP
jgi:AraC-like DNA-binding protein